MKIAEINKKLLKQIFNGNIQAVIDNDYFILYDDEQIKKAFNSGNGTRKDLTRYINNNRCFCVYYDLEAETCI